MRRLLVAALLTLVLAACVTSGGEGARPVSGPGAYIALGDSLSEGVGASVRGQSDFVSLVAICCSRVGAGGCPALGGSLADPECVKALRDARDGFAANLATAIEALRDATVDG